MYLRKVGTQSSVLIKQGALISDMSFKRGSTVDLCRKINSLVPMGRMCCNHRVCMRVSLWLSTGYMCCREHFQKRWPRVVTCGSRQKALMLLT